MIEAVSQRTVLVVEDHDETREAVAMLLEDAGFRVATVANGADAIEFLESESAPDLILLDLDMPILDGWSFLEIRRSHQSLGRIPIVIGSARAGPTRQRPYVGVEAVLAKPYEAAVLVEVIRQHAR